MQMTNIPLFPLGTVLFPQMILPLRIFEQRYRLMINECLKNDTPFGIILIREGDEVQEGRLGTQAARPHLVGTLAQITEVTKSVSGAFEITTIGTERFRLIDYHNDQPFMTGDIELWPEEIQPGVELNVEVAKVRTAFQGYLKVLTELARKEVQMDIPTDPTDLSYFVPNWLQMEMETKQRLLEAPGPIQRLQTERKLVLAETDFLEQIKEKAQQEDYPEADSEVNPLNQPTTGYDITARFSKN